MSLDEGPLDTLLEEEYYLLKILIHLVDDGLHECRRVCRQWYDVCNKLPVKIRVTEAKIRAAVEKFPNATDVSCVRNCCNAVQESIQWSDLHQGVDTPWFSYLIRFRRLHTLAINALDESCLRIDSSMLPFCSVIDESLEGHQMSQHLSSLEIWLALADNGNACLLAAVRCLTSLTRLFVVSFPYNHSLEPFTELKKIQDLSFPGLITNSMGQLMFPALTNLTSLKFKELTSKIQRYNKGVLEVSLQTRAVQLSFIVALDDPALCFHASRALYKCV